MKTETADRQASAQRDLAASNSPTHGVPETDIDGLGMVTRRVRADVEKAHRRLRKAELLRAAGEPLN